MKIAVIVGGWHYPKHFYKNLINQTFLDGDMDFFVVSHRDPKDVISPTQDLKSNPKNSFLVSLDRILYDSIITYEEIQNLGYLLLKCDNVVGDYYFFNQWTEYFDFTDYDYINFLHDDNYLLPAFNSLFHDLIKGLEGYVYNGSFWEPKRISLETSDYIANSVVPRRSTARGSFSIWSKKLLEAMGGKFSIDGVNVRRTGLIDNPSFYALDWNTVGTNFQRFVEDNNFTPTSYRLSKYYRVSSYMIEGERGLVSSQQSAANKTFNEGVRFFTQNSNTNL